MDGQRSAVMFRETAHTQWARVHQEMIPNTVNQRGVQPQTADTRQDGSMFISKDPNI